MGCTRLFSHRGNPSALPDLLHHPRQSVCALLLHFCDVGNAVLCDATGAPLVRLDPIPPAGLVAQPRPEALWEVGEGVLPLSQVPLCTAQAGSGTRTAIETLCSAAQHCPRMAAAAQSGSGCSSKVGNWDHQHNQEVAQAAYYGSACQVGHQRGPSSAAGHTQS